MRVVTSINLAVEPYGAVNCRAASTRTTYSGVRPESDKLASDYLAAVSASPYGKAFFVLASKQSTNLASINSTQLKSFPIPLPAHEEQMRIERIIQQHTHGLDETARQVVKWQAIKAGLMQDLLTGKVRVTPLLSKLQEVSA